MAKKRSSSISRNKARKGFEIKYNFIENIKNFLKPTKQKWIILGIIILTAIPILWLARELYFQSFVFIGLLFFPVLLEALIEAFYGTHSLYGNVLSLLLVLPYIYVISCAISFLFSKFGKNKIFLVSGIILLFFILGMDDPFVNMMVGPNYSCSRDLDCDRMSVALFNMKIDCVNTEWRFYDSLVNRLMNMSNPRGVLLIGGDNKLCTCDSGKCRFMNGEELQKIDWQYCQIFNESDFRRGECRVIVAGRELFGRNYTG